MSMLVRCAAKVNLCLNIVRRRDDGYHDLESLVTAVSVWDHLEITPVPQFVVEDERGRALGDDNTVWRAARLLATVWCKPLQVRVRLHKRIPTEAGLGGGSSDAAGVLLALRALWGVRWSWRRLLPLAARIGADVPFFLVPTGCAIVKGIGDQVEPIHLPRLWTVLAKPAESMPTKDAFNLWDDEPITVNVNPYALVTALVNGDWVTAQQHAQNAFERLLAARIPQVTNLKQRLLDAGAKIAVMSGSGTTVVGVFTDAHSARRAWERVKLCASWSVVARTVKLGIVVRRGEP